MAGVGFIIGAFDMTGIGSAFSSEMIILAGGNLAALLILGALANLILGTGLSITACYIFLTIVLAPALIRMDSIQSPSTCSSSIGLWHPT